MNLFLGSFPTLTPNPATTQLHNSTTTTVHPSALRGNLCALRLLLPFPNRGHSAHRGA